jgi:hypothetical protein
MSFHPKMPGVIHLLQSSSRVKNNNLVTQQCLHQSLFGGCAIFGCGQLPRITADSTGEKLIWPKTTVFMPLLSRIPLIQALESAASVLKRDRSKFLLS